MATEDDDFDNMFSKLSLLKEGEVLDLTANPVTEPVVESVAEPVVDPTVAVVEPVAEPVAEPVVEPVTEPTTRELLTEFTKAIKAPPVAAPTPPPAPQPRPLYDATEVAAIEAFAKDWPEQFQAIQAMLRGSLKQNNDYTLGEVAKVLAPMGETVQTVASTSMHSQLQRAIPDYDAVRDKTIAWATSDAQPDYLKSAYVSVIENGTVAQITDLVGRWRQSTGTAAPAKPAAAAKPAKTLSEAAIQAVQSLAPVVSQRTVTVPGTPTSFDDAFEAFSKAG